MGNSRLYVFTEYLPVTHSAHGLQAFPQVDVSTGFGCIARLRGLDYVRIHGELHG
jgi:hypothetical protein